MKNCTPFPSGISTAGLLVALAFKTVVLLSGSTEICISLWTSLALCVHPLKQLRTLQPNAADKCKVEPTIYIFTLQETCWTRASDHSFV